MTNQERKAMHEAIKRDKAIFERRVPDDVKKLVEKGLQANKEALKKLART